MTQKASQVNTNSQLTKSAHTLQNNMLAFSAHPPLPTEHHHHHFSHNPPCPILENVENAFIFIGRTFINDKKKVSNQDSFGFTWNLRESKISIYYYYYY